MDSLLIVWLFFLVPFHQEGQAGDLLIHQVNICTTQEHDQSCRPGYWLSEKDCMEARQRYLGSGEAPSGYAVKCMQVSYPNHRVPANNL